MKSIRAAAAFLSEHRPDLSHPLASERLETDGKDLYLRLTKDPRQDDDLVNLSKQGQAVFTAVVDRYLRQLDFDKQTSLAERWWPLGKSMPVVIDPRVAFGSPHVARTGIPTRSLWGAVNAGDTPKDVAAWFGATEKQVNAAVRFESGLRGQAA